MSAHRPVPALASGRTARRQAPATLRPARIRLDRAGRRRCDVRLPRRVLRSTRRSPRSTRSRRTRNGRSNSKPSRHRRSDHRQAASRPDGHACACSFTGEFTRFDNLDRDHPLAGKTRLMSTHDTSNAIDQPSRSPRRAGAGRRCRYRPRRSRRTRRQLARAEATTSAPATAPPSSRPMPMASVLIGSFRRSARPAPTPFSSQRWTKPVRPATSCPMPRVYVLDGVLPGSADRPSREAGAIPVLSSLPEAEEWAALAPSRNDPVACAFHVDTGLNRLGMSAREIRALAADMHTMDRLRRPPRDEPSRLRRRARQRRRTPSSSTSSTHCSRCCPAPR